MATDKATVGGVASGPQKCFRNDISCQSYSPFYYPTSFSFPISVLFSFVASFIPKRGCFQLTTFSERRRFWDFSRFFCVFCFLC